MPQRLPRANEDAEPHRAAPLGPRSSHLLSAGEGDARKRISVHDEGDALAQLLLN